MHTALAIMMVCNADEVARSAPLAAARADWTVDDMWNEYEGTGWAEEDAREIGKEKRITFRRFNTGHIANSAYPIKAYLPWDKMTAVDGWPDFRTWLEALEWVKGV